jgi:hypothetical protein
MSRIRPCRGVRWALGAISTLVAAQGVLGCGGSGATLGTGSNDAGVARRLGDGAATGDSRVLGGGDASVDASVDGGFCNGTGPVVQLPSSQGSYDICTSQLGSTLFENALCTCDDAHIAGYLQTTAFNSLGGPDGGNTPSGAAVGINNAYSISAGYTHVGGSLSVAGPSSVAFIGYIETDGDLRLAGAATIPGYTKVNRNAWLEASFTDLGPADVVGDLHHQGTVTAIPLSVGGANTNAPVTVAPPCPCGAKNILDVASIVAQAVTNNDDTAAGITPTSWTNVLVDQKVTLPCGRYYLDSLRIAGSLEITVTGRVALFIGADITVLGNLQITLGPTAQIDVFITNDLNLVGLAVFGDKARPADTRIYVGGSGNVNLVGAGEFVGNVYAPLSLVTAPGYLDVYGSIFAKDFQVPGYADFNYDSAITQIGNNCPPVKIPGECSQCGECTNGMACVGGKCGACTQDSDCCGQLACTMGQCEPVFSAPK